METTLTPELLAALKHLCDPLGDAISRRDGEELAILGLAKANLSANGYMATDKGRKLLKAYQ